MSKASLSRVFIAAVGIYLCFGLTVAATEQILSSAIASGGTRSPAYFIADVITQCLYLVGAGYLCAIIARLRRLAIALLTALGVLVGTFSLIGSWKSEPHWYAIALLVTYVPCLWLGWALRSRAATQIEK